MGSKARICPRHLKPAFLLCLPLLGFADGCRPAARPPKPLDQLTSTEAYGHATYQAHCAQCHYDRLDDKLHGPSLKAVFQRPYLPSGAPANDERVTATILHGRNMMPAQPDLDPQQTDALLAYLHTL